MYKVYKSVGCSAMSLVAIYDTQEDAESAVAALRHKDVIAWYQTF